MLIFPPHKSILFPIVPRGRNINTTEFLKLPATFTKNSFIITAVGIAAKGINAIAEALKYNDILRDLSLTNTSANCRVHDHSMHFVALCFLIAEHLHTHLFLKLCFCEPFRISLCVVFGDVKVSTCLLSARNSILPRSFWVKTTDHSLNTFCTCFQFKIAHMFHLFLSHRSCIKYSTKYPNKMK